MEAPFSEQPQKKTASPDRKAQLGFVHCRLCRQVGIAVFLSILVLEGAILFYFSRNYEQDRLAELERVNFAAIQSLVLGAVPAVSYEGLLADARILIAATDIRGGALYTETGRFRGVFGETPKTRLYDATRLRGTGRYFENDTLYETLWRFGAVQPSLQMIVRLDSSQVKAEVADFFWSILALVGAISVIVTGVTIFILDRLTLAPVLSLRQSLLNAGEDPSNPERHKLTPVRDDELGEAFLAFNQMLERLSISNKEIKKRQDALETSEGRFRDIVEASADWFWEMGPDLRFTFVSERFFEETGLALKNILGRTREEAVGPSLTKENQKMWNAHEEDLKNHRPFQDLVHPQEDFDGRMHFFRVSGIPFYDSDGTFLGYRGAGTDVTEYRRAEKELTHFRKMESIGSLAGGIAHNLNNLLQPILVLSQINKKKLDKGTKIYENMETIFQAGMRASQLVDQIAAFSRGQELNQESVDIYESVREGLSLIESIVPTSVVVKQDLDKDTGTVYLESPKIQTVFMNLVTNALDAMEGKNGKLGITLAPTTIDDVSEPLIPGLFKGNYAKLTVTDNGHGMDEETMNRIFDPFFTTKEQGKGTGLGLSTAFGTIYKIGGTIRATSTPNKGSALIVYLPLEQTDSP